MRNTNEKVMVLEIPAAEYAVVTLEGAVPDCIHDGWKFVSADYFLLRRLATAFSSWDKAFSSVQRGQATLILI